MAGPAPLISVPKNLYKHFAVLTLAITASVAVFADGENKQAIEAQIEQRQVARTQRAEAAPARQQTLNVLQDNRGQAVNGNADLGAPPPAGLQVVTFAPAELGEPDLATAVRRRPQRKPERKLPAVMPPGMAPVPDAPAVLPVPAALPPT